MTVVTHAKSLSMKFCLDCHRHPTQFLRAPQDIYHLASATLAAQGRVVDAERFIQQAKIKPPQSCSGCHR
jgi:hypothetical protein